ncbi:uncharacterized protein LOC132053263 [Lycium ferocissimum]|uniref:uncharacterized protein LOC132053263 n=1 Tax=Lycium ferocissimum TaxID=112874 RepID=UPI00281639C4|nr:uncharacterized protein LOC132053263 [Lycium ferocissimum]XP_059301197.1 uncharacterized protein LOC132053263 [Lycium ferocissimum]
MLQTKSFLSSNYHFPLSFPPKPTTSFTPLPNFQHKPNATRHSRAATKSHAPSSPQSLLAGEPDAPPEEGPIELPSFITDTTRRSRASTTSHAPPSPQSLVAEAPDAPPEEGPIELPSSITDIFATSDDPSTLQTATSLLLTGAISVFLFRSLRRRAKRAKELKLRSTGAKKTLKEEAVESLKAITPTPIDTKAPPSPASALLGGLTAGVIALLLYKFTTTVEASLNRQTLSDSFSVRQITITIRTIINGICYLATFIFGINSVGLFLYSGQLALNSITGDSVSGEISKDSTPARPVDSKEGNSDDGNKTSEDTK